MGIGSINSRTFLEVGIRSFGLTRTMILTCRTRQRTWSAPSEEAIDEEHDTNNEATEKEDDEAIKVKVDDAIEHNEQGPHEDPAFPELELGTVSHRQELG